MRLTRYTDYALRTLIYVGLHEPEQSSIAAIARAYGISENHLTKVVHQLGRLGLIRTIRGRGGGLRLAMPPGEIVVGAVVRQTEESTRSRPFRVCSDHPFPVSSWASLCDDKFVAG